MRIFTALDMKFPEGSTCVALGLFDGLHPGHVQVIRSAVEQAEKLWKIPCVFTFTSRNGGGAFTAKSDGSLMSTRQFDGIVEAMGVENVIRPDFSDFRDMSPGDFVKGVLLERLGAGTVICGGNFRFGRNAAGDAAMLAELCGADAGVHIIPMVERDGAQISSSRIRSLICNGDLEGANLLLGRRFAIDFEVVHGRALGRTLGSPTINQPFPEGFIVPRFGVYATVTLLGGRRYASVTNVGVKPTVGSDAVLAETYIHGFSGDLYGRSVEVEFLRFIRPEMKFSDVAELKVQIERDSKAAENIARDIDMAAILR